MSTMQKIDFVISASGSTGEKAQRRIMELAQRYRDQGYAGDNVLELASEDFIKNALERVDTVLQGMYQKAAPTSLFDGVHRVIPSPTGKEKIGDLYPIGKMRTFDGKVKMNQWEGASYNLDSSLKVWNGLIDYNTMRRLDSIFDQGFQRSLAMVAQMAIGEKDAAISAMLDANTAPHIDGSSGFFSTTHTIPGAGSTAQGTYSNKTTNAITTVAEVRTAVRKMQAVLIAQLSVNGVRRNLEWVHQNAVLICPPSKLELVEDAFRPGNMDGASDTGVRLTDKSALPKWDIRYNPYTMTTTSLWLLLKDEMYAPIVVIEQEAPNLITTAGDAQAFSKIMFNGVLSQLRYSYKEGYGSPFAAVALLVA
jgi:hypothetical protein